MGLVSLLSDFTYEGGRSVLGPYLALLYASPFIIGFLSGFSEFVGYTLRLLFGYLSDRLRRPWLFVFLGYFINLFSIPAMALVPSWHYVGFLMVLERLGKALRTPARDALLSRATEKVGHGKGFGVHEFLDQMGALMGPTFVALVLYITESYRSALASLVVPSLLALTVLALSQRQYWEEVSKPSRTDGELNKRGLVFYLAFSFLLGLSFVPFTLSSYHAKLELGFGDSSIPLLFAFAMLVDGIFALIFGYLFDRFGFKAMALGVLFTVPYPYFLFSGGQTLFLVGVFLWAVQLGIQESVVRSAIAKFSSFQKRGTAYGMFHFFFGVSLFLGGTSLGFLYQTSKEALILFSIFSQTISLLFLLKAQPLRR